MSIDYYAPGRTNFPIYLLAPGGTNFPLYTLKLLAAQISSRFIVLLPALILVLFFSDFLGVRAPRRPQPYVFPKKDTNRHCF